MLGIDQNWRFTAWYRRSFLMLVVELHWPVLAVDLFSEDNGELIALWPMGNKFYRWTGRCFSFEVPCLDSLDAHGLL